MWHWKHFLDLQQLDRWPNDWWHYNSQFFLDWMLTATATLKMVLSRLQSFVKQMCLSLTSSLLDFVFFFEQQWDFVESLQKKRTVHATPEVVDVILLGDPAQLPAHWPQRLLWRTFSKHATDPILSSVLLKVIGLLSFVPYVLSVM